MGHSPCRPARCAGRPMQYTIGWACACSCQGDAVLCVAHVHPPTDACMSLAVAAAGVVCAQPVSLTVLPVTHSRSGSEVPASSHFPQRLQVYTLTMPTQVRQRPPLCLPQAEQSCAPRSSTTRHTWHHARVQRCPKSRAYRAECCACSAYWHSRRPCWRDQAALRSNRPYGRCMHGVSSALAPMHTRPRHSMQMHGQRQTHPAHAFATCVRMA